MHQDERRVEVGERGVKSSAEILGYTQRERDKTSKTTYIGERGNVGASMLRENKEDTKMSSWVSAKMSANRGGVSGKTFAGSVWFGAGPD